MPIEGDVNAIAKTLRAGRSGVVRDLGRAGVAIVSDLRLALSTEGTGVIYTTEFFTWGGAVIAGKPRVPHRASAPGDPPARDTGALAASVSASTERLPDGAMLSLGSSSAVAVYTEFGTNASVKRRSTVLPRPWMRPTIAASHHIINREVSEGIVGRERAMARRLGGKG
ncbi:MAG: hypothetical protein ACOH10_10375 [Rhodoglobus sp.]